MTPAIDIAKKRKIAFNIHQYSHEATSKAYGEEAADKLGLEYERVFKTLVVSNPEGLMAVAVVAVSTQLNMKKMAKSLGWKKVVMADKLALSRSSGYVIGGVSPLGQKKPLVTVIDVSSKDFDTIFVSAGKRGLEIELCAQDLALLTRASFADISYAS
jgi:Cys-tRNA(Pro)/Cys-tRNA(Cys) deacylase